MDAGIKLIFATDAIFYPLTGIGRYAYELARRLPNQAKIAQVKYFSSLRLSTVIPKPPTRSTVNRTLRSLALRNRLVVQAYCSLMPALQWGKLRPFSDHLYHSPNYFLPPFPGRCVATFHDLSFVRWPQYHPPERIRFMAKEIPLSLKRADLILTDSRFMAQEIQAYFGLSADRVIAIPLAAGPEFRPRPESEVAPVLAALGLCFGGYALYVGTIEPRKNLDTLLAAFSGLPPALQRAYPLVLAGDRGWQSEALHLRLAQAQRQGWARYLEYVPPEVLPALYAGARVFAYPSRYEGFGLPVLEAMACGVPVVCSNAASLPEVAGEAALLSDPEDTDGLRQNLQRALEDEAWRKQVIQIGLDRARLFSWERTAAETVQAYGKLF